MTNEKLAELAQAPDNKELIPVLWDKVKDLLYMKAQRAYTANIEAFKRCGVELSDIRQSCYTAFLEALRGYKPESENKFTAYLNYPFKTQIAELTHTRTSRKEPLNNAVSLDKPLQNSDGDETTLESLIPDSDINIERDVLERLERTEEQQLVHKAVERLPELQRDIVKAIYFQNEQQKDIAARLGVKPQRVQQIKQQAFLALRRSPILWQLYRENFQHTRWNQIQRLEDRPEYFDTVQKLRERQEQGEHISYGKFKAELYSVHLRAAELAQNGTF